MELGAKKLSIYLLTVLALAHPTSATNVIDARGKTLSRGTDNGMAYAKFKAHKFSYLNITSIGSDYVLKGSECGLACVNIPSCFSFNLAAFYDVNRKILCELLPSDIYNNSKKFVSSQFHHHYSITSPCISWPCQNDGMCAAQYQKNSYACVCAKGFTGKYCEEDVDECAEGSHDCDVNANCSNTVGSFTCQCKPTYYGNGKDCKIIRLGASTILGSLDYNKYLGRLISYINPVLLNSDYNAFVRCWHAKTDGWAATTFHSNCDGKGPTVTIIKVNNYIFGGYTDVSWYSSPCSYSAASKAFLFSLYNINGYAPVKLTQYSDLAREAMYGCSSYGPTFGGHDIHITNDAVHNSQSYTHCGHAYSAPPGYSRHGNCPFFAGNYKFSPTDIEVFYETST